MNYKQLLITEEATVIQAMQLLDKTSMKILFIVDKETRLLATITDGDIRRWILKKGALDATIDRVSSYSPKYLYVGEEDKINSLYHKYGIDAMPIVDKEKRIVDILFANMPEIKNEVPERVDIPVVVMAGGLGTRLYPYTKILPKALVPVADTPIIEHIMNEFNKYGYHDYSIIVNHKKGMIKAYFAETDLPYSINFYNEDIPLGTGGGVKLLEDSINTTFFLTNCDILIKENYNNIIEEHRRQGNIITMVCSAKEFVIPYGIVDIDGSGQIDSLREKPSLSFLTNTGCYVVEPNVFSYIGDSEKIGFPDIIERCKQSGEKVGIYPISEEAWYDMGQMDELQRMEMKMIL